MSADEQAVALAQRWHHENFVRECPDHVALTEDELDALFVWVRERWPAFEQAALSGGLRGMRAARVCVRGEAMSEAKELPRVGVVTPDGRTVPHRTCWDATRGEIIDLGPVTRLFPLGPSSFKRVRP